jgi:XTP/dITP diphosphohydrolase
VKFVLASHNAHKVAEFDQILASAITGVSVSGYDGPEPVESGTTFVENAFIKARAAAEHTGLPALADDSGLCVDVLSGMPGIFSSRWSGEGATDERNVALVLAQMSDVPDAHRAAQFRCVIAVVIPATGEEPERELSVEGVWQGRLAREPQGVGGFGYDPVFIPEGHNVSAAQLDPDVKNALSHRARAIAALAKVLSAA